MAAPAQEMETRGASPGAGGSGRDYADGDDGSYVKQVFTEVMFGAKTNALLVFLPVALMSSAAGWGDGATFLFALAALCPLAERISFVTEELAKSTNETIGGLMNASMGNITELIVSFIALKAGLLRIVQVSLIGSIFSNLLLVQGTAFLAGGWRYQTILFNKSGANANVVVLLLATMALLLPSVLDHSHEEWDGVLHLSRGTSLIMLMTYAALVVYQLVSHRHLFDEGQSASRSIPWAFGASPARGVLGRAGAHSRLDEESEERGGGGDDDDDAPVLGFWAATIWLAIITVAVAVLSDVIVGTIEGAATALGFPILFIGTILLPIVGNACEHAAAVVFCYKNKPDLAIGIAVGSAAQISLFVIPLCVVVGWMMDQPLSLDFHEFETQCLQSTVLIIALMLSSGEADWLRGCLLVAAYMILSIGFWVHKDAEGLAAPQEPAAPA